ncbi:MAG TPA: TPM domain-containing protein, partial [Chitinophagaceae bacterium]|nr:TPM domain-containing protein [Chitinophagaceae bacterium]
VAVVLIPTLGDYSPEEVGLEIIRTWGVGNKNTNNGIVILVAKNDRKVRIEVGYGLEGAIPDITAKSIIDNEITPNF